ncbi:hypothetical protein FH972_018144 [Carpinus fangiana]|uniref:Deoxyuridine 5'-triphosphate nucleotidohydrolase n=1 Tax=Carpinus fangiana TaxID=176857 RepID=A0A5N6RQ09_9ROSI|nr:hypothetical protein FH972_018144 [Carpinus fangiana]
MYLWRRSGWLWQAVAMGERWECRRRSDGVVAVVVLGTGARILDRIIFSVVDAARKLLWCRRRGSPGCLERGGEVVEGEDGGGHHGCLNRGGESDLQSNNSPEIKEPLLKVLKLGQNGVFAAAISENPSLLLRVKKLSEKAVLPLRASPLSAGYDLSSATETKVPARGKALVPTDLSIAIPKGTYAHIAPRSGLAWKHSIDVGDRIAQLIIEKIMTSDVMAIEDLDSTARGTVGFGSTGV